MNLKHLADEELDQSTQASILKERESLTVVLNHIVEVERRKLFLRKSYPSLFAYLTEHLKYSNGTAQRRIEAARLMKDFPALPEKLESGELNLAQVSIVQKAIRQKKKETKVSISKDGKCELLDVLVGKTEFETQQIVAQTLDLENKEGARVQTQQDESVRLEVTLSKEQWGKLQSMRELLSTSLTDGSWDQVLTYVAEKVIQQKTKPPVRATESIERLKETTKRSILQRDQCCQYRDPKSKRLCGSRWNLQVDHIKPQWAGGKHRTENLRVLCGNHNRQIYREQVNIRMNEWFGRFTERWPELHL